MTYLPANEFACAAGIAERTARHALSVAAQGKPWRGHHLPVVQLPGQRGGAGGVTWGLDLAHVSPDLVAEAPGLRDYMDKPTAPTAPQIDTGHTWRVARARERLTIIRPILDTAPRSRARGEALRAVAAGRHLIKGTLVKVSLPTLKRWIGDFERGGIAALQPQPSNVTGARRVLICRAWDNGIDLSEKAREAVAAELATYTMSLIAKAVSGLQVQRLTSRKLAELSGAAGSELSRAALDRLCRVNQKYTDRFKAMRRVARHDLDNKAFFDNDLPRIARGRSAWPMELVYGDVHPIDIYVKSPEGKGQLRLRLIAWMDDCTRYMWATVAVFGKGQGIRQIDIADALYRMVCDPAGGVPRVLYLDNGGEYAALADAMAEIPGAVDALAARGGVVKAMPYNGPAKGLLEHAFSTLEQGYFKHIPGWIGGDRTNKKTEAVGKPVKGFEGPIEDLVEQVLEMVAAYNDAPQGGLLGGKSPRQMMQAAIDMGWQAVALDEDAFDFAFSHREDRTITQGRFRFDSEYWVSDQTLALGAGDAVQLRIPLRSDAQGVFVLHDGKRLAGRAVKETLYHPLDRAGAREKSRRTAIQAEAIRTLKASRDPAIDPATEILRGVNRIPLTDGRDRPIIRLADADPAQVARDEDAARRAEIEDLLRHYRGGEERRTDGE